MPDSALPIGAWAGDRNQIIHAPRPVHGDAAGLPHDVQFQVYAARAIRQREKNVKAEKEGFAAFVLVSADEQKALLEDKKVARNANRTVFNGAKSLVGAIHFMTHNASSSAVEPVNGDDNAMMDRLDELRMNQRPTLLYFPQEPDSSLFYFPKGIADADSRQDVLLNMGPVAENEVMQVLDAVYAGELITPDNTGPAKLWMPGKDWPIEQAERTIQQLARCALIGRFYWCTVQQEQAGKFGRTDLEIVDDRTGPPGQVQHHALLELKVLRSVGSTGKPESQLDIDGHITKGLGQAYKYGEAKNFVVRLLCCYDMRREDVGEAATFAHVRTQAGALNIGLKRWYLYRTSDAARLDATEAAVEAMATRHAEN